MTQLVRAGNFVEVAQTIPLAARCTSPVSVAIRHDHLFAVGANCIESHAWPSIDAYGDLTAVATTAAIGVPSFNGVAFSQ